MTREPTTGGRPVAASTTMNTTGMDAPSSPTIAYQPGLFIDGAVVDGGDEETIELRNPALETVWARVGVASAQGARQAVQSARTAFESGAWRDASPEHRGKTLRRIAQRLRENRESLGLLESQMTGKPLNYARDRDVERAASIFDFYADLLATAEERLWTSPGLVTAAVRRPVGVATLIVPWNYPLVLAAWKVAPCLAAGNSCILKPAEPTPLTAFALAEIATAAGLPRGVLNVVSAAGGITSAELVGSPNVDLVSFTGGTSTGRAIAAVAAQNLTRTTLELGGKSANIVFADCDLERAAKACVGAVFENQGAICLAGSRILVQREVHEDFMQLFKRATEEIVVGDPLLPETRMGPLISPEHRTFLESAISRATDSGAVVFTGGDRPFESGYFLNPTAITGISNDTDLAQQELFGPVAAVIPFRDEGEAIDIANNSPYGLASGIWTKDQSKGWRVAGKVRAGVTWINTWHERDLRAPFGGLKASGYGHEGGSYGLEFFSDVCTVATSMR